MCRTNSGVFHISMFSEVTLSYSSKGWQQTFGFIATATMKIHCPLSKYV